MFRPERMSKISVTGSTQVMESVIETVHEQNLLHVSEYDGSWEGFEQGNPEQEAEWASEKLVTVRAIESILGVEAADADAPRVITHDAIEEKLPEVQREANRLDDRRGELRDELRTVEERLDGVQPFVDLGISLDLLSGYDSLEVAVGEGDAEEVERALLDADGVTQYEIESGEDGPLAVFLYPSEHAEEAVLDDALVGTGFTEYEVPDADGAPESYRRTLESRRQQLRSELDTVENELDELTERYAEFLLAAEESLSIDVQKAEAPLSFATTENAFIAEGWIPTDDYTEFTAALTDELGDRVEVEEVERASFTTGGDTHHEAVADGGHTASDEEPPVVQDNPDVASPFEVLVKAVGNPNYREFDPTVILFLTFPLFFGFMIGDVGYGVIYSAIGYYLYESYDAQALKSLGGVTLTAGLFTVAFGFLYGEIFGLHLVTTYLWEGVVGLKHAPIEKGLSPATGYWAEAWFLLSAVAGIIHLNIGYAFQFLEDVEFHGLTEALQESGSWLFALNGVWLYVFSRHGESAKPEFLYTVLDGTGEHAGQAAFSLGFTGFPVWVGFLGAAMIAVGFVLLAMGEPLELVEFHTVFVHVLSYLRIPAVLLAKAGMAFAVNLLFFGAYSEPTEEGAAYHFMLSHGPEYVLEHSPEATIMFSGLVHGSLAALLVGILVLVVGHLVVLILGVTSSGIQAARLEYFEFFAKFYDGNGRAYTPFGYERTHSTES